MIDYIRHFLTGTPFGKYRAFETWAISMGPNVYTVAGSDLDVLSRKIFTSKTVWTEQMIEITGRVFRDLRNLVVGFVKFVPMVFSWAIILMAIYDPYDARRMFVEITQGAPSDTSNVVGELTFICALIYVPFLAFRLAFGMRVESLEVKNHFRSRLYEFAARRSFGDDPAFKTEMNVRIRPMFESEAEEVQ